MGKCSTYVHISVYVAGLSMHGFMHPLYAQVDQGKTSWSCALGPLHRMFSKVGINVITFLYNDLNIGWSRLDFPTTTVLAVCNKS